MKVTWSEKNIFMNYDEPAYIIYDTEGATVRLRAYEVWDSNQAIYFDDTITGTNRTGKGIIQLWTENPHGTPPSNAVGIYVVIVEVYNTANALIETYRLKYMYTRMNLTTINVKDENNNDLLARITYATIYNNESYFKSYYGTSIIIPYPTDKTKSYLEILSIKGNKKYYLIDRFDRIATTAGTYNVKISPKDKIIVYMDIEINNTVINTLMSIPGLNYLMSFLLNISIQFMNYGLVIGNYIRELLGLKDYYIVKVEKVSDTPLTLRFYYATDIAPILIAFILGLGVLATINVWIIFNALRDMRVAELTYETQKVVTEAYNNYLAFRNKVLDYCKDQPDPVKCQTEILSTVSPPPISSSDSKENQDSLTATIDQLKNFLLIAIIGGIILAVVSYLRK